MSRNMRAVRVEWSVFASLFMPPEAFETLAQAVMKKKFDYEYDYSAGDEAFKFRVSDGHVFLNRIRDCEAASVVRKLKKELREDAMMCLENMKALEPEWRRFIAEDNSLELWIDG